MADDDMRNELICSICRNIYTDPVCLLCGHNFCRECIVERLSDQDETGGYSCPECREKYKERPALHKNITLANIAAILFPTHPDQDGTGVSGNRSCSAHNEPLNDHYTEDGDCGTCCEAGEPWDHRVQVLNVATPMQRERLRNAMEDLHQEREEMQRETAQRLPECSNEVEIRAPSDKFSTLLRDYREQLRALGMQLLGNISRQMSKLLPIPFTDQMSQLEIKMDMICRKMDNIEELCNMTDLLTFLQAQKAAGTEGTDIEDRETDEIIVPVVAELDLGQILEILNKSFAGFRTWNERRTQYGKRVKNLLLDRKRTGRNIRVSEDRKSAFHNYDPDHYQDAQVLSTTVFNSGHYYWDVEASEWGNLRLGVISIRAGERGTHPWIGDHEKSWCLYRCRNNTRYMVKHDNKHEDLAHVPSCRQYRVSLDYEAGHLSFYELSDPIKLLYTFTATFTEPLHAGFWVWRRESNEAWVRIIN